MNKFIPFEAKQRKQKTEQGHAKHDL